MWLLVQLACQPEALDGRGESEPGSVEADDPAADYIPGTGLADTDDDDDDDDNFGCSEIFDQERLVVYEVEIEEGDWHHLETEWRTSDGTKDYVPITRLTVDGEEVPDAMMRLKGNYGCCWVGNKMQFVVSFNEVDQDARFYGERKVALDSPYYEPTSLKNRLAHWFIMQTGLPGDCTNNALLYVNGEYYGLYAHMEELDHEYLKRNFGKDNDDGDLWKYGYVLDNHDDEDVDTTRINQFWSSYLPEDFVGLGDPDEWLTEWAVEAVLPDGDGYWCCGHNYFLYDHPTRGFLWIPWDMDGTFDWVAYNTDPTYLWYPAYTPHMASMLEEDEYRDVYIEKVLQVAELYGSEEMMANLAEWTEQTYEWGLAEPNRYYDNSYYEYYVANLPAYVEARRGYLQDWARYYGD